MYYFSLSDANGANTLLFPIPLEEVPDLDYQVGTETFRGFDGGDYTYTTGLSALEIEVNTWFPWKNKYPFQVVSRFNEWDYFNKIHFSIRNKAPLKVHIYEKGGYSHVNCNMIVTGYKKGVNRYGESTLVLKLREHYSYAI